MYDTQTDFVSVGEFTARWVSLQKCVETIQEEPKLKWETSERAAMHLVRIVQSKSRTPTAQISIWLR